MQRHFQLDSQSTKVPIKSIRRSSSSTSRCPSFCSASKYPCKSISISRALRSLSVLKGRERPSVKHLQRHTERWDINKIWILLIIYLANLFRKNSTDCGAQHPSSHPKPKQIKTKLFRNNAAGASSRAAAPSRLSISSSCSHQDPSPSSPRQPISLLSADAAINPDTCLSTSFVSISPAKPLKAFPGSPGGLAMVPPSSGRATFQGQLQGQGLGCGKIHSCHPTEQSCHCLWIGNRDDPKGTVLAKGSAMPCGARSPMGTEIPSSSQLRPGHSCSTQHIPAQSSA